MHYSIIHDSVFLANVFEKTGFFVNWENCICIQHKIFGKQLANTTEIGKFYGNFHLVKSFCCITALS